MSAISPLWSWDQMPMDVPQSAPKLVDSYHMFTDVFRSAINNVKETDAEVVELQTLQATGELDNPALLTIADSKATAAVDLLVQLRSKALDAYNELMRISL